MFGLDILWSIGSLGSLLVSVVLAATVRHVDPMFLVGSLLYFQSCLDGDVGQSQHEASNGRTNGFSTDDAVG